MKATFIFLFSIFVSLPCMGQQLSQFLSTYTPVIVNQRQSYYGLDNNIGTQDNLYSSQQYYQSTPSLPVMELKGTITTYGFYVNRSNEVVRINLKVNKYNQMGSETLRIVQTRKIGYDWKDCPYEVVYRTSESSDGALANTYEYKANFGVQTVYFNL